MLLPERTKPIPPDHPIHELFRRLTARGLSRAGKSETELVRYLSDLLVRFVHIDAVYRLRDERGVPAEYLVDMVRLAEEESEPSRRRDAYRHVGDFALFMLGFYPERIGGRRRLVGPDYYAAMGRRCYDRAAETAPGIPPSSLLRRLANEFETCAVGLNWVREYTHDPFYQYMLRQFGLA